MSEPSDTAVADEPSFDEILAMPDEAEPTTATEVVPNNYAISVSLSMSVMGEGVPFSSGTASFTYVDGTLSSMNTSAYGPNGYIDSDQLPTNFLRFANMLGQIGSGRPLRDVQDQVMQQGAVGMLGQQFQQPSPRLIYGPSGGY